MRDPTDATTRVGLDYHVDIDGHYYSVPHWLIREQLDARITAHIIELFCKGEPVAVHLRGTERGRHTTITEHMPSSHRGVLFASRWILAPLYLSMISVLAAILVVFLRELLSALPPLPRKRSSGLFFRDYILSAS